MTASASPSCNVRVALRVRPLSIAEKARGETECISHPNPNQVQIGNRPFTFDKVFKDNAKQIELYGGCAEPLLNEFMKGYNATILAYGQTGSGKTYTMGTSSTRNIITENLGVVPRIVDGIFKKIDAAEKEGKHNFGLKISFLEIHRENINDLLRLGDGGNKPSIREEKSGDIRVDGMTEVSVTTREEMLSCLERGTLARATACTAMNTQSSRSHAIFTVHMTMTMAAAKRSKKEVKASSEEKREGNLGELSSEDAVPVSKTEGSERKVDENEGRIPNPDSKDAKQALEGCESDGEDDDDDRLIEDVITAKFHFVDLAGSERLKKTKAEGERLKEGININSGLLALGNVISALGDPKRRGGHVPFRDSKITRLLQDSLGGNSQTLMIACVSPGEGSLEETVNTLKYANRAKNIKNKPIVNRDPIAEKLESQRRRIQELESLLLKTGRMNAFQFDVGEEQYEVMEKKAQRAAEEVEALRLQTEQQRKRISELMERCCVAETERDYYCEQLEKGDIGKEPPPESNPESGQPNAKENNTTNAETQPDGGADKTAPLSDDRGRQGKDPAPVAQQDTTSIEHHEDSKGEKREAMAKSSAEGDNNTQKDGGTLDLDANTHDQAHDAVGVEKEASSAGRAGGGQSRGNAETGTFPEGIRGNERKQQIFKYLEAIAKLEETIKLQAAELEAQNDEIASLREINTRLRSQERTSSAPTSSLKKTTSAHRREASPSSDGELIRKRGREGANAGIEDNGAKELSASESESNRDDAEDVEVVVVPAKRDESGERDISPVLKSRKRRPVDETSVAEAKMLRFEARSHDLDLEIRQKEEEKTKLMTELISMRQRAKEMQKNYEVKIQELETAIRMVQEEHDKTLRELNKKDGKIVQEKAKLERAYEKKMHMMKGDLAQLNKTKRDHARLMRGRTKDELRIRHLETEISTAKQERLSLKQKIVASRKEFNRIHRERATEQRHLMKIAQEKERKLISLSRKLNQQKIALDRRTTEKKILHEKLKKFTRRPSPGPGKRRSEVPGRLSVRNRERLEEEIKAACGFQRLRKRLAQTIQRRDHTIHQMGLLKLKLQNKATSVVGEDKNDDEEKERLDSLKERKDYCTRLVIELQRKILSSSHSNTKGCLDASLFQRIPTLSSSRLSNQQVHQAILFLMKLVVKVSGHLSTVNAKSRSRSINDDGMPKDRNQGRASSHFVEDPDATPRVPRSNSGMVTSFAGSPPCAATKQQHHRQHQVLESTATTAASTPILIPSSSTSSSSSAIGKIAATPTLQVVGTNPSAATSPTITTAAIATTAATRTAGSPSIIAPSKNKVTETKELGKLIHQPPSHHTFGTGVASSMLVKRLNLNQVPAPVRRDPLPNVTPPRKATIKASPPSKFSADPRKRVKMELNALRSDPVERAKLIERIRKMKRIKEKERREYAVAKQQRALAAAQIQHGINSKLGGRR